MKMSAFYITETYGCYIFCSKDYMLAEGRQMAMDFADCKLPWGERKTHIVHPAVDNVGKAPHWRCHAWLDGPATDPGFDGSELVVVWFQDDCPADPVASALSALERDGVCFKDIAQDYNE